MHHFSVTWLSRPVTAC